MNVKASKLIAPLYMVVGFLLMAILSLSASNLPDSFVHYYIPDMKGWYYAGENTTGDKYVFRNSALTVTVNLVKNPVLCETSQEFNRIILKMIQELPATREYMEQRKSAVPYTFLDHKNGHMLIIKSRETNQRRFLISYMIGSDVYHIDIIGDGNQPEPPAEAISFLGGIQRGDGKGTPPPPNVPASPAVAQKMTSTSVQQGQNAKENSAAGNARVQDDLAQNAQNSKSQPDTRQSNNITTAGTSPEKTFSPPTEWQVPAPETEKGNIPEVKFSVTDPCANGNEKKGLPWEKTDRSAGFEMPKGVEAVTPPYIPDLENLSQISYTSAVSLAFEAMRLVYGPMPEEEARKFEMAWAPLFDFPTQEIIDYLNKLNPIVSQFLACREAYIRTLNDFQIVMLDASIAIEADERYSWESAMAEAALYASSLKPLEYGMKMLALELETLGNPPDPNAAKCDAQRRYRKFFEAEGPEGCWSGYQDNIFLSDGEYDMFQSENNERIFGLVHNPKNVYVFRVNVGGAEKYYSLRLCIDCNMGMTESRGNCSYGDFSDSFIRENLMGRVEYTGTWIDGPRQGKESQHLQKFEMPDIPDFQQISDERIQNWIDLAIEKRSDLTRDSFEEMLQEKRMAASFFETAIRWTKENRWQQFSYPQDTWMVPDNLVVSFNQDMMEGIEPEKPQEEQPVVKNENQVTVPSAPENNRQDEEEAKALQETIAHHTEMMNIIKHNLERDMADRKEALSALSMAKTQAEAENHARRIKDFDLRIINHQSNMQAEQDLIDSHKTGQIVRTRTVFDDYAHSTFIDAIRENAARMDATRRIAERINRQIELLPWEQRAEARDRAEKILDAQTVASGDIEKARKLTQAINNQIQGYAEYDHATAKEAEINSEQNEFYAQMTIVAAGAGAIGFGSAALAEAFGAQAAITIYGTKALGAIYGGVTGAIAGGPKEGLTQAVSYWSPYGYAATQFVEGFQRAGYQKDNNVAMQIWEGAKQAGSAWAMGKAFEFGAGLVAKGSLVAFGKDSRLFKPVVQTPSQRSKQVLDGIRTQQKILNAQDEVSTFQKLESNLAVLKRDPVANASKIAQMEKELNQLAAGLNASYYAKWNLKYKADPLTRSKYDRRIQHNYSEMTPGMIRRMEQQGYNMNGIEFRQFRNAGSGGTSSMDLDLGPVMKSTGAEPGIKMFNKKVVVKKDGTIVTLEQFTDDAQKAMNAEYRQLTGMSASTSDMNLVTSVHKEAFSTPKLLDHNVDFSNFTPEEIASVGKVLEVKMDGINKNQMLTNTSKMQAKCRESSKEIENMLLRKLKSDLQQAPAGSPQQKQLQSDIKYWEDMLQRFKQIGTDEINPSKIIELNREIMRETGGRDVNGVIKDLTAKFK